jgi:hypothetical protein
MPLREPEPKSTVEIYLSPPDLCLGARQGHLLPTVRSPPSMNCVFGEFSGRLHLGQGHCGLDPWMEASLDPPSILAASRGV